MIILFQAWSFLRPVSQKGRPNLGPQRLQLFEFSKNRPHLSAHNVPQVYYDYVFQRNTGKEIYPSTLHVSLEGIAPPVPKKVIGFGARAKLPTDREVGRLEFSHMRSSKLEAIESEIGDPTKRRRQLGAFAKRALERGRMPHERCLLPIQPLNKISCSTSGCLCVAFSPDGSLLAAACSEETGIFTIKLFNVTTGAHWYSFTGHHNLIYDLSWNKDGSFLVSSSSDCSARLWLVSSTDTGDMSPEHWRNLQHTSYVYCGVIRPTSSKEDESMLVVTGAYDNTIRV